MSEASTIPATEEELAAARNLPRPPVETSGLSTPQDKILRRNTTDVLPGHVGDIRILATATPENQPGDVSKGSSGKGKSKPARSVKKKQKKAKGGKRGKKPLASKKAGKKAIKKEKTETKSPVQAQQTAPPGPEPANATPSQVGSAATSPQPSHQTAPAIASAPQPRPACKKAAAKKPDASNASPAPPVKVEPKSERIRRKNEVQTPPSVRESRAVAQAEVTNMQRRTTHEQFRSPTPSTVGKGANASTDNGGDNGGCSNKKPVSEEPPLSDDNGTEYYDQGSEEEEEEAGQEEEDESENGESDESEKNCPDAAATPSAGGAPATEAGKKKKKEKKERTPEQKAVHARYMKFHRSIRSTFAAS
eukprot:s1546_g13.t1